MRASEVAVRIKDAIEALTPLSMAHDGDRFRGLVAEDPEQVIDRCFSVAFGLPVRNPDLIDPTEYVVQGTIGVAYRDGPDAYSRVLDDAEQIAECLYELADGADLLSLDVSEGQILGGPVQASLIAARPFTARYRYS